MRRESKIKFVYFCAMLALLLITNTSYALILHDDNDQPPSSSRPPDSVLGRWSSNASCVAISSDFVITTRHQGTSLGSTVVLGSNSYQVVQLYYVNGVDIAIARIQTSNGTPPNLTHTSIYTGSSELGEFTTLGGYGKYRAPDGNPLDGYNWYGSSNDTLRWGTNIIDSSKDVQAGSYLSNCLIADFDKAPKTTYEAASAEWDSGGGWFIDDWGWKLVALNAYTTRVGSTLFKDKFYGIRLSSYAEDYIIPHIQNLHIISGKVTDLSGNPIAKVSITDSTDHTITQTDPTGNYQIWLPDGWTGSLIPSKTGYQFEPHSINFTSPLTANISNKDFNITDINHISDNFDDNITSANWIVNQNPALTISETDQQLQFHTNSQTPTAKSSYKSNEWTIEANQSFSLKIDFHSSIKDPNLFSAHLKIQADPNNYALAAIGNDQQGKFYNLTALTSSDVNQVTDTLTYTDGTLTIYYNKSTDKLYLTLGDYADNSEQLIIENISASQWANAQLTVEIALESNSSNITGQEFYFDNFTINTGQISNWPPSTDINKDGFINISDLKALTYSWLTADPNADITQNGTVDLSDLTKLNQVW